MASSCVARSLVSGAATGGGAGAAEGVDGAGAAKSARMSGAMRPWKIREKKARKAYFQRFPWEIILPILSRRDARAERRVPSRTARQHRAAGAVLCPLRPPPIV